MSKILGVGAMIAVQVAGIMPSYSQTSGTAVKPATRWELKADAGLCTLIGSLSSPDEVYLYIQTIPGSDYYRLAVSGKGIVQRGNHGLSPASIVFHDSEARFDRRATTESLAGSNAMIRFDGLDKGVIDAFAHATSISINRRSSVIGPLVLSIAAKAAVALDACTADQLIEWGADPTQFRPGGARPVALKDRDYWISNTELRGLMLFASRPQGELKAVLRVSISSDGHVDQCARVEGPSDPAFEKSACEPVLSQMLFQPAHDPDGKAVRGAAVFEIRLESHPAGR